jgi:RNA polymerase sigma-70 factor (ECF subfamily)
MTTTPSDRIDDAELVRAVVAGSETALEALYDRHVDTIHAVAMRLTDDRTLAEEVVQETFLALWNRAELFDPAVGSLATWMRTIARNRTIDRMRASGRRPVLVSLSPATVDDERDESALDRLVSQGVILGGVGVGPGPEQAAERAELRAAVGSVLATLPAPERTVIELAYQDDLTQVEIAERLGWPLGTVKTRTRRALFRLREALGRGGDAEGRLLESASDDERHDR